jgi:tetratricopeptide (TPR) repeat protein
VVSDPLNVILATVRAWNDRARVRATLSRIAKHRLVFHDLSDPMHLTFTPEERKVIDYIRAETPSASALFQAKIADEEEASSLLYALAVTRQFAFKGQKGEPMGGRGASIPISIAPPAGSDEEVVAIPPSSTPPKFTAPDFADNLARASAPPEQPARASQNPPLETAAERAIEAMTQLRLAETALERNDLAQAERFAARAVANDPYQSDYVALHTWIRAMTSNKPESLSEAILALSKLLASDPKSERALLYRGKLLKKMNRIREALRDFERLVQANPRHREGVQELRLLRQRATK